MLVERGDTPASCPLLAFAVPSPRSGPLRTWRTQHILSPAVLPKHSAQLCEVTVKKGSFQWAVQSDPSLKAMILELDLFLFNLLIFI